MEKFFIVVDDDIVFGLRYDGRLEKEILTIGGFEKYIDKMEEILESYFIGNSLQMETMAKRTAKNKVQISMRIPRKEYRNRVKYLKSDIGNDLIPTVSLGRVMR